MSHTVTLTRLRILDSLASPVIHPCTQHLPTRVGTPLIDRLLPCPRHSANVQRVVIKTIVSPSLLLCTLGCNPTHNSHHEQNATHSADVIRAPASIPLHTLMVAVQHNRRTEGQYHTDEYMLMLALIMVSMVSAMTWRKAQCHRIDTQYMHKGHVNTCKLNHKNVRIHSPNAPKKLMCDVRMFVYTEPYESKCSHVHEHMCAC